MANDIDLDYLVRKTDKFNNDDIVSVCKEAFIMPMMKRLKLLQNLESSTMQKEMEEEMMKEPITMDYFV